MFPRALVLGVVVLCVGCQCGPAAGGDDAGFGGGLGGGAGGGAGGGIGGDAGADAGTDGGLMCGAGYELVGASCIDIDECMRGTAGCDPNATCANSAGSFTCTCNSGWLGDGRICRRGFAALSAGERHVCALMLGGSIACWGFNENGMLGDGTTQWRPAPTLVGDAGVWSAVGAADFHSCGIKTDGSLWCWGYNSASQLGTGAMPDAGSMDELSPVRAGTDSDWKQVAGTNRSTCALKLDGRIFCWGGNYNGELGITAGGFRTTPVQLGTATNWVRLAAGVFHLCAIDVDGSLFCWGDNFYAQRGNGTLISGTTIARVGAAGEWAGFGATGYGGCGIKKTGELWCWGRNDVGQVVPTSMTAQFPAPQRIGADADWAEVVGGAGHACARKQDGRVFCWGSNRRGAGAGLLASHQPVTRVGNDVYTALTAGEDFTCALKADDTAWCWGENADGQLGQRRLGLSFSPRVMDAATDWAQVSSGRGHTCARKSDGSLWCWGAGWQGQLGLGNFEARTRPTRVGADVGWTSVSTGDSHTCGVRAGGLYCWGENQQGQVGDGTFDNRRPAVTQVGAATDWASVTCGGLSCCAQKTSGALYCWGYNSYGQLGINSFASRVGTPTQVGTATDWVGVSFGDQHACARKTDGSLWCWGYGAHGQLGRGSQSNSAVPVRVGMGTDWSAVSCGNLISCGVASGELRCWGFNYYGQTGTGSTLTYVLSPTAVGTATNWLGVGAGTNAGCATRTDDSFWCWGTNRRGLLATGNTTKQAAPVSITLTTPLQAPRLGMQHACALTKAGGGLWCWGENEDGQLGDGTGFEPQPLQVLP